MGPHQSMLSRRCHGFHRTAIHNRLRQTTLLASASLKCPPFRPPSAPAPAHPHVSSLSCSLPISRTLSPLQTPFSLFLSRTLPAANVMVDAVNSQPRSTDQSAFFATQAFPALHDLDRNSQAQLYAAQNIYYAQAEYNNHHSAPVKHHLQQQQHQQQHLDHHHQPHHHQQGLPLLPDPYSSDSDSASPPPSLVYSERYVSQHVCGVSCSVPCVTHPARAPAHSECSKVTSPTCTPIMPYLGPRALR